MVLVVLAACTPSPGEVTPTDTEATDATSTDEPSGDASSSTPPATTGDVVDDTVRRRG